MSGFILWEGNSLYDGSPIVVIATMSSGNVKTGDMVQTWILRQDVNPIEASRLGLDKSICGNCPHMGKPDASKTKGWASERSCYVNLLHGPLGIWKAYTAGRYPVISGDALPSLFEGKLVRIGSYGDPAAAPVSLWREIVSKAKAWTAYTHASKNPLPEMLMTSADSLAQAESAWQRKERTFRVIKAESDIVKGKEILCPASKEAGYRSTCADCRLCNGALSKAKSIAIVAHGKGAKYVTA